MRRVGVVGLVSLDRVDGGLPRLGGAPFYAASALRLLGRPAVVVTKLADEDRPRLNALEFPVVARSAGRTIAFRIENAAGGRRLAIDELGEPWTPNEARGWLADVLAGVDRLHIGALTRADFPPETLAALARARVLALEGHGLVRPARVGDVSPDADYDPDMLRYVHMLKLAREELDALGLSLEARSLRSLGVPEVVVTLGGQGAALWAGGTLERVPTTPLEGIDPTGAGDAWMTAYLMFRTRRHGPGSAARLANGIVHTLLAGRERG